MTARAEDGLWVAVHGQDPCATLPRLASALDSQFGEGRVPVLVGPARAGARALRLQWTSGNSLRLELADASGKVTAARSLEVAAADCHELPQTIAVIVGTWVQPQPVVSAAPEVVRKAKVLRPPAAPVRGAGSLSRSTAEKPRRLPGPPPATPPPPPTVAPATQWQEPVKQELTPLEELAQERDDATDGKAPAAGPPSESRVRLAIEKPRTPAPEYPLGTEVAFHRVSVAVLGGGFLWGDGKRTGLRGSGRIEWGIGERWGVAFQADLDGAVDVQLTRGAVTIAGQAFALLGRLALELTETARIDILAGPVLHRLFVEARGFDRNGQVELYDVGGSLALQYRQLVVADLSLLVGVRLAIRGYEDRLKVTGIEGPVFVISPLRGSADLGLSWTF